MEPQNNSTPQNKVFNIRKKIASAGSNNIIVIPKILQNDLKKGSVVDIRITVLQDNSNENMSEGGK
ncbi:MAG: hypothetical protein ACP5OG_04050 [Candidatus Nanoarchaeia archaeon]